MSKKNDVSRRQFLSRTALTLPVAAAAIPAAMELTSPMAAKAGSYPSVRQYIPNRTLQSVTIGTTTKTIASADLPSNDTTDFSATIQHYIDSVLPASGGTLIIPWKNTRTDGHSGVTNRCVYAIDMQRDGVIGALAKDTYYWGIKMRDNVRLVFEPGVTLKALTINTDTDKLTSRAYMILCQGIQDAEIFNGCLVGERDTHKWSGIGDPATDEWIYGINIAGSQRVNVVGTYVSDMTGDGIQVGRYNSVNSTNVTICNCICTRARRQAISLTGCTYTNLYDSEFSYTSGTNPQNGIDLEPMGQGIVDHITIDNCIIRGNSGDGIEMNAASQPITNVDITNCLFQSNYWNAIAGHNGTVDGGSIYGSAFFQNGKYGISFFGVTGFTIGASATDGSGINTNSFANNNVGTNPVTYPNTTTTAHTNYVTGSDMNTDTPSLNTWRTNVFTS